VAEGRLDHAGDAEGDAVLQIENVLERAFKAVRPQMRPRFGFEQLCCDPHTAAGLPH